MKNDPEFNIEFVQLIERYPVLYNFTLAGYSNKAEVEKAWNDIGVILNETGTACQEKWRILRGGFNRYIKKKEENTSGVSSKKPYYLAKYMEFLTPYLKSRTHNNMKIAEESPNGSQFEAEVMEDDTERESFVDHCEVVYDEVEDNNEILNRCEELDLGAGERIRTQKYKRKFEASFDFADSKKYHRFSSDENPDLLFMKSLLPDMALLDKKNKMKFKIQVLTSLNNLLYNGTTVSSPELTSQHN